MLDSKCEVFLVTFCGKSSVKCSRNYSEEVLCGGLNHD